MSSLPVVTEAGGPLELASSPRRGSRIHDPAPASGGSSPSRATVRALIAATVSPRRGAGGHLRALDRALRPDEADNLARYAPIGTPGHILGTDQQGRDMLARLLFGGRVSLLVGVVPTLVAGAIGLALGLLAGFVRGVGRSDHHALPRRGLRLSHGAARDRHCRTPCGRAC